MDDSVEVKPIKWTYSSWAAFKKCARQYLHRYILKDIPYVQNEAGKYGDAVHKAIEDYLMQDTPIPDEFHRFKAQVEPVKQWKGQTICEMKLAVDKNLQACDYYGDYWARGKADVVNLRLDKGRARILDWKTSKSATYADIKQVELMACLIFAKYPEVERVDTALLFLMVDKPVTATFYRKDLEAMWRRWQYEAHTMQLAEAKNQFGPNPTGLCKQYCDVTSCEFNGKYVKGPL